jgi:hypothetical protein
MSQEREILELKQQILRLKQQVFGLKQKQVAMKAEYEAKLKAKKRIVIPEEERVKLLTRRDKAIAANARLR